ncbi:uncharacterized protein LOC135493303 [Lineus longissimus]|uniref:uncharacterized protein LOC135493303 n=1 Tax=Lineus longissimus TaxID=88925 RepID=UPI002B4CA9B9
MSKISPGEKHAPKHDYEIGNATRLKKPLRNITVDFVTLNNTEPENSYNSHPPITSPTWSQVTALPLRNTTSITSEYENTRFKSKTTIDDLYKEYDPVTGIKTGGFFSGCLFLALMYMLYKKKCRKPSDSDSRRGSKSKVTIEEETMQVVTECMVPRVSRSPSQETTHLLNQQIVVEVETHPEPNLPDEEVNAFDATAEWVQTQPLDMHSLSDMSIVINIENASASPTDDEEYEEFYDESINLEPTVQENMLTVLNADMFPSPILLPSPILETCSDVGSIEDYPVPNLQMQQRNSISNPVSIPTIPSQVTRPKVRLGHKQRASSLKRPSDHDHRHMPSLCSNISNQKSRSSNTLHVRFSSDTMINKPKRKYRSQMSLRSNSCSSGSSRSSKRSDLSNRSDPSSKPLLKRITDKFTPSSGRWFKSCDHLPMDYSLQVSSHSEPDEQTSMLNKSHSMQDTTTL